MKKMNDFGRDSIPLLVLKISIPFMFAQFVNVLYSIVDRIYVGNIPGTGADALAGVGVCAPIVTLLSSFGTLFGIGGSVLFSVRLGAEDEKGARKVLANSFSMLIIVSLVLTVLFLLTRDQLLNWFGASETIFPYADTYMTIYTAGTFFALLSMGMNYFITAQGFPVLGMLTTLIGAVVNIVLDPVFIFLFHMDVAGAALATVIAQISSCLFAMSEIRSKVFLAVYFTSAYPHLYAQQTDFGQSLSMAIIYIGSECVQRSSSFFIHFGTRHLGSVQTSGNLDFDTFGTHSHRIGYSHLYGTAISYLAFHLASDVVSYDNSIKFRPLYLKDIDLDIFVGNLLQLFFQLIDFLSAFTNNKSRTRCANCYRNEFYCALDNNS